MDARCQTMALEASPTWRHLPGQILGVRSSMGPQALCLALSWTQPLVYRYCVPSPLYERGTASGFSLGSVRQSLLPPGR